MPDKKPLRKLIFIHDRLPFEGISGMIVFYRHFMKLVNWEIHIIIPQNAYYEEIVALYPSNFYVHTFNMRKKWWPPFRENNNLLLQIRLVLLSNVFKRYIAAIKPDCVVTVLYHHFSLAAGLASKKTNIRLITFLHDRWDLKSESEIIQQKRRDLGRLLLNKSDRIFSVTSELCLMYSPEALKKTTILFPITDGTVRSKGWKTSHGKGLNFIYAGTVEQHHIAFFEVLIGMFKNSSDKLTVITADRVDSNLKSFKNFEVLNPFKTNKEALQYIADFGSVVLVNYGLSTKDNKFAFSSFPSKFAEYCHLAMPILAVAPEHSPFYNMLQVNNWELLITEKNIDTLSQLIYNLKEKDTWERSAAQSEFFANEYFKPEVLQLSFENQLINIES